MPDSDSYKTQSESLFHLLKTDIVRGTLPPDSKLRLEALRERYKAGATPLREALSRLSSLGFVTAVGQRGFRVATISAEDLLDLTKVRIWVESVALRNAIAQGDSEWEASISGALKRLKRGPLVRFEADGSDEQEQAHRDFHRALVSACNSPHLLSYREHLFELSDRYRRLSVEYPIAERDTYREHAEIAAAVLAREADRAERLIAAHFLKTAQLVLRCNPLTSLIAEELVGRAQSEVRVGRSSQFA